MAFAGGRSAGPTNSFKELNVSEASLVGAPAPIAAPLTTADAPGHGISAAAPPILPNINNVAATAVQSGMPTLSPSAQSALAPSAGTALLPGVVAPLLPAAPLVVPPTPAALAVLAAATDSAQTLAPVSPFTQISPTAAASSTSLSTAGVGSHVQGVVSEGFQTFVSEGFQTEKGSGEAHYDSTITPPALGRAPLTAGHVGAVDMQTLQSTLAASVQQDVQQLAVQQQLQQQIVQQQLQQQIVQQQLQQIIAKQQRQQQEQSLASGAPCSVALSAELTAAGFPAAAAALCAQQQQIQRQQQLMFAAGLSPATLLPTGAAPAELASGMPAMQAVPALAQGTAQATGPGLSQPLVNQVLAQPSLICSQALLSNALSAAPRHSTASATSVATPKVGVGTNNAAAASCQLSQAIASLTLAQQQQQQQQAAAAANATNTLLQAGMSSATCSLLPSVASNMSLSNLKSGSVASSVLSSIHAGQLAPIPSSAPSSSTGASSKVRVLLSSGGEYEEVPASEGVSSSHRSRWRYVGGETRLVGILRSSSYSDFLQQLSKATSAVWDESCRLMYDLPSNEADAGGTLVDLIDDEDLEMMWEELAAMLTSRPSFRLHIYVQLGCKRSSAGAPGSSTASEGQHSDNMSASTPKAAAAIAAATAAAAAVGSSSTNSAGTPRHVKATGHDSSGSAGRETSRESVVDQTSGSRGTGVTFASSEYAGLVDDIVSEQPQLNLSDLEAKLDIILPEDLTPVRLLGSGGFGEVYLCRWLGCDVAVKCLNPSLLVPDGDMGSLSKDNVSELLREASMLSSVRHPNIVWVYGLMLPPLDAAVAAIRQSLGSGQGIDAVKVTMQMANKHRNEAPLSALRPPALVTEYLASGSLRAALARKADFVTRDSVKIKLALDAARGLEYLHGKSIVHFDLKTANLLVGMRDKTPVCKVADFGLSKQKQQTYVTGVATLRGTLPWIAPEIIKTPGAVTEAVDVYSFGVVLWELWTLREPFEGINYHALLHLMSTSNEAVRPPLPGSADFEGEVGPEPALGWADTITECLMEAPSSRPTFKQLVSRLEVMLRQNRLSKKRSSSGPPGTGCDTSTPASQGC